MRIPISKPYFDKKDREWIKKHTENILKSGWLTSGKFVRELENDIKKLTGARYAAAVSSGTAALHLCFLILDICNKDIILPSYTFVATAHAALYCDNKLNFCDIDINTANIDFQKIKQLINKRIKAVLIVHQFGMPCKLDNINQTASKYKIKVIEDAACALGSKYKNQYIGNGDNLAIFSLHPRKILTTGEGGIIVTNNKKYYDSILQLRNHGITGPTSNSFAYYDNIGYNYRMSELQAILGLSQIKKINKFINKRRESAEIYKYYLKNLDLQFQNENESVYTNYQSFYIYLDNFNSSQAFKIYNFLMGKGIEVKRGIMPIHKLKYIKNHAKQNLINTEHMAEKSLLLPMYYELEEKQIKYITDNLKKAVYSMK